MTVAGYARVSTLQQASEGVSLAEQERQIRVYAELYKLGAPSLFIEEGVSGSVPFARRPQGGALLGQLQPGDVVIAAKLDRMFRSARDALAIVKRFRTQGIKLHLLDFGGEVVQGPISKLVFTILVAVSEFERNRGIERTREAHAQLRAQGRKTGTAYFGWRNTEVRGVWIEVPHEQAVIREICQLKKQGLPMRRIAQRIERQHGVKLRPERIFGIWQRASDPAAHEAKKERERIADHEREARRWDEDIRSAAPRQYSFGEAVAAYALSRGFDVTLDVADYPRTQRQDLRRFKRLIEALGSRPVSEITPVDLAMLAETSHPSGSPNTRVREVIGPATSTIHHVAALGWVEDR
jgi:DNA invertase Pin-like site-specific DNA recombinase